MTSFQYYQSCSYLLPLHSNSKALYHQQYGQRQGNQERKKMVLIHYRQMCMKEIVDMTEEYKLYKVIRLK